MLPPFNNLDGKTLPRQLVGFDRTSKNQQSCWTTAPPKFKNLVGRSQLHVSLSINPLGRPKSCSAQSHKMSNPNNSFCPGSCMQPPPQIQLYQTIIFATPVLFAFLLLLLFCMFYVRRRRNAGFHSQLRPPFFTRGHLSTTPFDHGLSKSFRQRLPTVPFDEKFTATREDTQCAVCLGDYELNDKLHQLPVCHHSFHVQCIDEWLAKNSTCPICRISLLPDGRGGPQDSFETQDANSMQYLLRTEEEENRQWEEMVVSENQDGLPNVGGSSNGASSSGLASSETTAPSNSEHAVNIERS